MRSRFMTRRESPWCVSTTLTRCGGRGAPSGRRRAARNHKHRLRTVRPYDYTDAAGLLTDFWAEVDAVPKERGVLR
jgi:hypothetical protein